MVSRRDFPLRISAASMTCFVQDSLAVPAWRTLLEESTTAETEGDNAKLVMIAIETGGHVYHGATMPFGAVQQSLDTGNKEFVQAKKTSLHW